jgi:hypothetical protein
MRADITSIMNAQHKGMNGSVLIDEKQEHNWDIYPLEFKQKFVEELKNGLNLISLKVRIFLGQHLI